MLRPSLALLGFGLLVISACSPAHYVAEQGRESILGMDADTLKSCEKTLGRWAASMSALSLPQFIRKRTPRRESAG
jgi:hypothetical protein